MLASWVFLFATIARPSRGRNTIARDAHVTRRATADGKPRWDVRSNALGRWQTMTFKELHPHDLRHAAGTFVAQQGATTKEIMARLGHRSPALADRHQHAASRRDAERAAKLQLAAEEAQARRGTRSHH